MNAVIAEAWMDLAVCTTTDPDLFFPEPGDGDSAAKAKRVCASCPVRSICETYATDNSIVPGIWGGRAYKARRRAIENQRKKDT